jgi:hypothetical protein
MKRIVALVVILTAGAVMAQVPDGAQQAEITFSVANPNVEPAHYSLTIREDGTGEYKATYTPSGQDTAAAPVNRPIRVNNPLLSEAFAVARKDHFFAMNCRGHHPKVAFSGEKTLTYSGPDGKGSCTLNFSQKKEINDVTSKLMAVAYTLAIGSELKREHRYDRLSLDSELSSLEEAVQNRQALELGNIAPTLESIAADGTVMHRARARAKKLLHEASVTR